MNSAGSSRADVKLPFCPSSLYRKIRFSPLIPFFQLFLPSTSSCCLFFDITVSDPVTQIARFIIDHILDRTSPIHRRSHLSPQSSLSLGICFVAQDLDSDSQCRLGSCFRRTPSPTSLSDSLIQVLLYKVLAIQVKEFI